MQDIKLKYYLFICNQCMWQQQINAIKMNYIKTWIWYKLLNRLCSLHIYFYYQGEFTIDINQEGGGGKRENKTNSPKMLTERGGG